MSRQEQQTLAFFGATGGCTASVLVLSLKANYNCVAMVRTPEKLRKLLESEHSIPSATLDQYLTITQGNITDEQAIKTALTSLNGCLPDKIIYGIGAAPKFQVSLTRPMVMDQPTICADGMNALLSALRALQREGAPLGSFDRRPMIACVSTTGISKVCDVPIPLVPMYKYLLHTPHVDKRNMENALLAAAAEPDPPVAGFVFVKPTLLGDGKAKSADQVRAGWVWPDGHQEKSQEQQQQQQQQQATGPQLGYLISRASVGAWMFERLVAGDQEDWLGKNVSLA